MTWLERPEHTGCSIAAASKLVVSHHDRSWPCRLKRRGVARGSTRRAEEFFRILNAFPSSCESPRKNGFASGMWPVTGNSVPNFAHRKGCPPYCLSFSKPRRLTSDRPTDFKAQLFLNSIDLLSGGRDLAAGCPSEQTISKGKRSWLIHFPSETQISDPLDDVRAWCIPLPLTRQKMSSSANSTDTGDPIDNTNTGPTTSGGSFKSVSPAAAAWVLVSELNQKG